MRRCTPLRLALVGGILGALPGVIGYRSAVSSNAPHESFVDAYLVSAVLAIGGAIVGFAFGAILGAIGTEVRVAKTRPASRRAERHRLDEEKAARVIEARAEATGMTPEEVRDQLLSELGVFPNILDEWLAGEREMSGVMLWRVAHHLETTPETIVGVDEDDFTQSESEALKSAPGPGSWALFFVALAATVPFPVALLVRGYMDPEAPGLHPGLVGLVVGAVGGLVVGPVARLRWRSLIAAAVSGVALGLIQWLASLAAGSLWAGDDAPFYVAEEPFFDFLIWLALTLVLVLAVEFVVPAVVVMFVVRWLRRRGAEHHGPNEPDARSETPRASPSDFVQP